MTSNTTLGNLNNPAVNYNNFAMFPDDHIGATTGHSLAFKQAFVNGEIQPALASIASKTAVSVAKLVPPTKIEQAFVNSSVKGVFTMAYEAVNANLLTKAVTITLGVLAGGVIVYSTGKYICDKIYGDDSTNTSLVNNPVSKESKISIAYKDGRPVRPIRVTDGGGASLDWREISKIEIQ